MPDLSAIARERAALAMIADGIVAASVDKGLRIEVACPPSRLAVADHLAQALHARGRVCRCRPAGSNPGEAGAPDRGQHDSGVMVITGGLATGTDRDVLRVGVRVTAAAPAQEHRLTGSATETEPDIVLDYQDPDGPMIRYLAPHLRTRTPSPVSRPGSPS
ncbi:hypothetical protein ABZV78_12240 [Micromonospora sp. NPDC004540]|uniref:hypothetical protein n=1 Tax=Micromonospora sp. NPDC004540 TaxID=3154457 RepID=UPI0033BBAC52